MGRYQGKPDLRSLSRVRIGRDPWDNIRCHCDTCLYGDTHSFHGNKLPGNKDNRTHHRTVAPGNQLELVVCDKCTSKYTLVWAKSDRHSHTSYHSNQATRNQAPSNQAPSNQILICQCDRLEWEKAPSDPRRVTFRSMMSSRLTELLASDFLCCPLCTERYTNPAILPCLHSFCEGCIKSHIEKGSVNGVTANDFKCPVCETEILTPTNGKTTVRHNHFLGSLGELAECQTVETKECDYCKYDNKNSRAIGRCLECQDSMCVECMEAHRRTKVTRGHKIAPYTEVLLGKYDSDIRSAQQISCTKHSSEPIKFFCAKCERLICRECRVTEHDKHHCPDLEYSGDLFVNKTRSAVANIKNKVPGVKQYVEFLSDYNSHIEDQETKTLKEIDARAAELHKLVDDHRDDMVNKIKSASHREIKAIGQRQGQAKHILKVLDTTTRYLDNLFDLGKPEEILIVKHLLTERLQQLAYMHVDAMATKVGMRFTGASGQANDMNTVFGKVDIMNCPLSSDSVKTITKNEDISIATALPSVGDCIEQLLVFECRGLSDIKDIWPTGVAADDDGNIAVLDRENKRVKIFDEGGELIREFGGGCLGCPYDITLLKNSNIAVTDYEEEDVKVFTPTGELINTFKGGMKYPRGITTNRQGEILVVDCHSRRIITYEPRGGAVISKIEGKDEEGLDLFTDPYYVCVNSNGYIIVTDWAAPNIKLFNAQGKYCTKYGTYGSKKDQILQPYGVCVDKFGYIFVADNQNHRIHLLAPDGKFIRFLVTKQHGLWHPMAIAINNHGHLVVTEALGKVKVFKYL